MRVEVLPQHPRLIMLMFDSPPLIHNGKSLNFVQISKHNEESFGCRRTTTCHDDTPNRDTNLTTLKGGVQGVEEMTTSIVTISNVRVFENENGATVQLVFNEPIDGITIGSDGSVTKQQVNTISVFRSRLTAQLCGVNDDIALYRATQTHGFNQKQLGIILTGAKLKINRELVPAGTVDGDYTYSRDSYTTDVVGVTLTERAIRKLDDACSL